MSFVCMLLRPCQTCNCNTYVVISIHVILNLTLRMIRRIICWIYYVKSMLPGPFKTWVNMLRTASEVDMFLLLPWQICAQRILVTSEPLRMHYLWRHSIHVILNLTLTHPFAPLSNLKQSLKNFCESLPPQNIGVSSRTAPECPPMPPSGKPKRKNKTPYKGYSHQASMSYRMYHIISN